MRKLLKMMNKEGYKVKERMIRDTSRLFDPDHEIELSIDTHWRYTSVMVYFEYLSVYILWKQSSLSFREMSLVSVPPSIVESVSIQIAESTY